MNSQPEDYIAAIARGMDMTPKGVRICVNRDLAPVLSVHCFWLWRLARKARRLTYKRRNATEWRRLWLARDHQARNISLLRSRVAAAMRRAGLRKSERTIQLLGCTWQQLKTHLEGQFEAGMRWEDRGRLWHVDHIVPCSKFDLSKVEQQRLCFHFTNLQPLWKSDNLRKATRITRQHQFPLLFD